MNVNSDAERAVLGAACTFGAAGDRLTGSKFLREVRDHGIASRHFYSVAAVTLWDTLNTLDDEGMPMDLVTLKSRLSEQHYAYALDVAAHSQMPSRERVKSWAQLLIEAALWRNRQQAVWAMQAAIDTTDEPRFADAEMAVGKGVRPDSSTYSPDQLAEQMWRFLETNDEVFKFPFARLDDLTSGGMRRGEVTLLGGWSSHGKSAFLDQTLELSAASGRKVHLYINEMTPRVRVARFVARKSDVLMQDILRNRMDNRATDRVVKALGEIPYPISDVAGWGITDICRHIRHTKPDVCGVDMVHLIEHRDERDLAAISRELNQVAKVANCHVLATVHLNENRVVGQTRPLPTTGDIRGSGMLKNDADNVLFVFREQDADTGFPQAEGRVYFAKARSGQPGGVEIRFDGAHQRFMPTHANWSGPQ